MSLSENEHDRSFHLPENFEGNFMLPPYPTVLMFDSSWMRLDLLCFSHQDSYLVV